MEQFAGCLAYTEIARNNLVVDALALHQDMADNMDFDKVCCTGNTKRYTGCDNNNFTLLNNACFLSSINGQVKELICVLLKLAHHDRCYTPGKVQLTISLFIHDTSNNSTFRTILGNHACGEAGFRNTDDGRCIQIHCCCTAGMGNGICDIRVYKCCSLFKTLAVVDGSFCTFSNLHHCLNGFDRIKTCSCFAGKHDGTCTVIDGIGNVCGFCTRRARVLHHGIKHLCSCDNNFAGFVNFLDDHLLQYRYILKWNFNTHITTSYHDTI